ncbi:hypothetical protein [Dyadobacter sandarakinus]|uniref:Uncharacterized protein n=1 Tax=Dyadobacter sandarakinus TaxID=2747268 RepID=A0ABX7I3W0_9BACT|nr:hypothetical protein [Dyadobacter sandarakinus]QRR00769.1 hypothetical protein HWI92_07540 [Dyadobacter sandarakinus]
MSTQPQTDSPQAAEPGDSAAADQLIRTYGSKVKELPSQGDASQWIKDL